MTYTHSDLVWMEILKNICAVKSMCYMEEQFIEENGIATLKILSDDKSLVEIFCNVP